MTMANHSMMKVVSSRRRVVALCGSLLVAALGLNGCAVEVQNLQPVQELAAAAQPPGSVYTGWRVFQDRCAGCHGPAASGTAGAPDLLARVRDMPSRRFVSLVLDRYDWSQATGQPRRAGAASDAVVEDMLQRKQGLLTMPAWQGEPRVAAHIVDLYAYLSARADGKLGPGKPRR